MKRDIAQLLVGMLASRLGKAGWGVILIVAFFVEWLLPAWFETAWGGQTPGKRLFRLVVLNDDGTPVRWPGALTRNLLRAADFLPFLYGVGLLSMLMNRDFKRLGDLAAGTVVVYTGEKSIVQRNIPDAAAVLPPIALACSGGRKGAKFTNAGMPWRRMTSLSHDGWRSMSSRLCNVGLPGFT